jgi:hypothetical protein
MEQGEHEHGAGPEFQARTLGENRVGAARAHGRALSICIAWLTTHQTQMRRSRRITYLLARFSRHQMRCALVRQLSLVVLNVWAGARPRDARALIAAMPQRAARLIVATKAGKLVACLLVTTRLPISFHFIVRVPSFG